MLTFTRLSKTVSVLLCVGYGTQLFLPDTRKYIALVPGRFFPCVWNIFTAGLLETHVLKAAGGVAALLFIARRIEPVWGSREFLTFICAINLCTGAATLALIYVIFFVTATGEILWTEVSGIQGIIAACLVGVRQVMPEDEITVLSFIKFRAKNLSFMYVVAMSAGAALLQQSLQVIPSVVLGTYLSWAYLRFLQQHSGALGRGDPSFRFATLFPEPLQPGIDRVTAVFGGTTAPQEVVQESLPFLSSTPAGEDAEAKRRRDRGARALEARLGTKRAAGTSAADAADQAPADVEAPASSA